VKLNELLDESYLYIYDIFIKKEYSFEIFGISLTLFHYYTYLKSFREFDRYLLCSACLFLAAKMKNSMLKIEDLQENYSLTRNKKINNNFNNEIIKFELEILNLLGFDLEIETPYQIALHYFKAIKADTQFKRLEILTYNYINDSYRRPLAIYFKPMYIALSAIFFAFSITYDDFSFKEEFFFQFDNNLDFEELVSCVEELSALFSSKLNIK